MICRPLIMAWNTPTKLYMWQALPAVPMCNCTYQRRRYSFNEMVGLKRSINQYKNMNNHLISSRTPTGGVFRAGQMFVSLGSHLFNVFHQSSFSTCHSDAAPCKQSQKEIITKPVISTISLPSTFAT